MLTPESSSPEAEIKDDVQIKAEEEEETETMAAGEKRESSEGAATSTEALPPRKRAKTTEEKEQRRIQRIMRNRQAAHASREKKRKHVENLEKTCADLTDQNKTLSKTCEDMKKKQVQMLEQQYLLATKIKQYQTVIQAAKALGDLSALDNIPTTQPELLSPAATTGENSACSSPASIKEEYASPDSLVLSSMTTAPSSPLSLNSSKLDLSPLEVNSQSQHPAVVLFKTLACSVRLLF
ncbi:hypothetical protein TRICI_001454 [Trichomonascus ciferrii]|uniref:BZIP domain-containing protein n=1 Tax=Trichomonascus ciferrii TaxID=44093 RepID=A0A642V8G7_9ASCO|nr:hypothetical protein TRICI_001454 [Trichomonascus ciferrii]